MATNNQKTASKIVSAETIRSLIEGSFEHLGVALDEAIQLNRLTIAGSDTQVSRVATFGDRVLVGTSAGEYFNLKYEHKDGEVNFLAVEKVDVPVVTSSNAKKSIKEHSLSVVDSLLGSSVGAAAGKLLVLADLQEQQQVHEARDYVGEALAAVAPGRPWRQAYAERSTEIRRQVVDQLESIRVNALESKYRPMYETDDIPEERFGDYGPMAFEDLNTLSDRLRSLHERVETAYLPFRDGLNSEALDETENNVLSHFCFFSEDLIQDLGEVRALIADTIENEQCVMCLGQVYDTFADSLADYEIAGSFVQRMAGAFDGAA